MCGLAGLSSGRRGAPDDSYVCKPELKLRVLKRRESNAGLFISKSQLFTP